MNPAPGAKILSLEELLKWRERYPAGRKVVLCHGHFNTIHPGHVRFLNYARAQGDALIIAVMHLDELPQRVRQSYFDQHSRALGVAALDVVDAVYALEQPITELVDRLRPEVYVKGKEFETQKDLIADQIAAVERCGGKVVFGSGDVQYALDLLSAPAPSRGRDPRFLEVCRANGVRLGELVERVKAFERVKLLVVGDTIVDQFVSCDVLGVSAEAPVMTIRELQAKEFVGGAAVVACHVQAMGASCTYLSVIGNDAPGEFVQRELSQVGAAHLLLHDESRPTTYKIRYLVDNQKLLRVSRLRQHALSEPLESSLIERISRRMPDMDGVIISDFVYGVISPRVLDAIGALARKHGIKMFADLQCSSQFGDASKFRDMTLLTPTEKEARVAMGDFAGGVETLACDFLRKTNGRNLVLKLGAAGLVAYAPRPEAPGDFRPVYFPALEAHPVDVAGAGDALLSAMAVGMCGGLDVVGAAALGTCAAAISVSRMGNVPVTGQELIAYLGSFHEHDGGFAL